MKFQEGDAVRAEEELRKKELKHTMKRKIEELRYVELPHQTFYLITKELLTNTGLHSHRANKVPEAYIKEIERKLTLNEAD